MKLLNTFLLIFVLSVLTNTSIFAESVSEEEKEKALKEKMYDEYGQLCDGGKFMLKYMDFLSLPKDDSLSIAPIDWMAKLKGHDITLIPSKVYGPMGPRFYWEYGDIKGYVSIAIYLSPTEAQLGLADILGHIPVKLPKGTPEGGFVGDSCFHGSSNIYFVRKNILVHVKVEKNKSPQALSVLCSLARDIDNIIVSSKKPRLEEAMPFEIATPSKALKMKEKKAITVLPKKDDRPFRVHCEKVHGTARIKGKLESKKDKTQKQQVYSFEAQAPGDGVLKVYICEKSGMVWTYYFRYNAFE